MPALFGFIALVLFAGCPATPTGSRSKPVGSDVLAGAIVTNAADYTDVRAHLTLVAGVAHVAFTDRVHDLVAFAVPEAGSCADLPGLGWAWVVEGAPEPMIVVLGEAARVFVHDGACWRAERVTPLTTAQSVSASGASWDEVFSALGSLDASLVGLEALLGESVIIGAPGGEPKVEVSLGDMTMPDWRPGPDWPELVTKRVLTVTRLEVGGVFVGLRITTDEHGFGDPSEMSAGGEATRTATADVLFRDGPIALTMTSNYAYARSGDGSFASTDTRTVMTTRGALIGQTTDERSTSGSDYGGEQRTATTSVWQVGELTLWPPRPSPGASELLESAGPPVTKSIGGCTVTLTIEELLLACPDGSERVPLMEVPQGRTGRARAAIDVAPRSLLVTAGASLAAEDPTDVFESPPAMGVELMVSRRSGVSIALGATE